MMQQGRLEKKMLQVLEILNSSQRNESIRVHTPQRVKIAIDSILRNAKMEEDFSYARTIKNIEQGVAANPKATKILETATSGQVAWAIYLRTASHRKMNNEY